MIKHITFQDKDRNSLDPQKRTFSAQEINILKNQLNQIIDVSNQLSPKVFSVNGLTGKVVFDFPVLSVNGKDKNITFKYPLSLNQKTGNVDLKISEVENDTKYITSSSIKVTSINGLTGKVVFDFPVTSVNKNLGNVILNFPVTSVNTKTGILTLKISDLENDKNYITSSSIKVTSVNSKVGVVTLKISELENDNKYLILNQLPLLTITVNHENINNQALNSSNKCIFIPKNLSQLNNDSGFKNSLKNILSTSEQDDKITFQIK